VSPLRLVALGWLVFIAAFGLGVYVYASEVWPYPIIRSLERFVTEDRDLSLLAKLRNDLGLSAERHETTTADKGPSEGEPDAQKQPDDDAYRSLDGLDLKSRRQEPEMFLSEAAPRGYRVLYGTFDFSDHLHGAILIGPDGDVENVWQTSQEIEIPEGDRTINKKSDKNVYPHGFEIAPDGSIVTGYDRGSALVKYDYCGEEVWHLEGRFHHSVAFDDGGDTIWVWGKHQSQDYNGAFSKIDYRTGEVLREHDLGEIREANPDFTGFEVRQELGFVKREDVGDFHPNDIEPLPKELAGYYPQFEGGDLLFSVRNVSLIFVADPETFEVKWWRQGLTLYQHDPDWNERGTITIFDNRWGRPPSRIVEINPRTFDDRVVLDGGPYNFYTQIRGKHDEVPGSGFLVTSSNQGRVFEVDPNGELVFDFRNLGESGNDTLAVSEALFLPPDYFDELPQCEA